MAVGLLRGRKAGEGRQAKTRSYELAGRVVDGFRVRFGDVRCRELTGLDLSDPDDLAKFRKERINEKLCEGFVTASARVVVEVLTE